jgi:disulfide bond formation protein DsbB
MNDTLVVFLALLAVLCQAFVVCVLFATAGSRLLPAFGPTAVRLFETFKPIAAPLAFVVATVTMLGSLYMSEIKHFPPCHLCWIQRGFLYPQVILSLVLIFKPSWRYVRWLTLALLVACVPVSIYHYILEWYPNLHSSVCDPKIPCTLVWFREFGYVTLPLMALSSALTQIALQLISYPRSNAQLKG